MLEYPHLLLFFVATRGVLLFLFFPACSTTALSSSSVASPATIRTVHNLLSICTHLQNPDLYSAAWANACDWDPMTSQLVTSRDMEPLEILSFFPIHAIGFRAAMGNNGNNNGNNNNDDQDTLLLLDALHGDFSSSTTYRYDIPTPLDNDDNNDDNDDDKTHYFHPDILHAGEQHHIRQPLFASVQTERLVYPGWMGHLAQQQQQLVVGGGGGTTTTTSAAAAADDDDELYYSSSNCEIVALPGATPLCALLATEYIPKGTPLLLVQAASSTTANNQSLVVSSSSKKDCAAAQHLYKRHTHEINELRGYLNMAYPPPETPVVVLDSSSTSSIMNDTIMVRGEKEEKEDNKMTYKSPFYYIDRSYAAYPNLQVWHSDPDILVIDHFLNDDECDRLIQKAEPHLIPCVTKNPRTGVVERDASRTSTNTNIPQREVPTIVEKMMRLLFGGGGGACPPSSTSSNASNHKLLEILQVVKYTQGQYFQPHTDGFSGPVSACGFQDSARLVTIFVYLNSSAQGGATRFTKLDLDIQPKKGRAVLHFPTTTGFEEDLRTQHEGAPAIDDKWLLVTWLWMHPRSEGVIYAEDNLDPLDDTII